MTKKIYAPKKAKVSKWKKILVSVHGKLVQQMQINEKLSPSKGKGGSDMGR